MQLQIFTYEDGSKYDFTAIEINGEPWFIASEVCKLLDIRNTPDAVSRLDDDEKSSIVITDRTSGNPNKTIISESGLYALIFKSKKESAAKFRKWVTKEVIPSIRKTGTYSGSLKLIPTYQKRILSKPVKGLPYTHWCVFTESHPIMLWIEENIGSVNQYDLVDGSIGIKWSQYRKGKPWAINSMKYIHEYDDNRGSQSSNAYQNFELTFFKEWLNEIYMKEHFYDYLYNKYRREKNVPMLNRVVAAMPKLFAA